MSGRKFLAAVMGALIFFTGPAATMLPEVSAAAKKTADANKKKEGEKKPPRQKGGKPEVLTYERAMEIEMKRHTERLERIRKHYRNHRPKLREAVRQENEFHAKRVEEIQKRFGMA